MCFTLYILFFPYNHCGYLGRWCYRLLDSLSYTSTTWLLLALAQPQFCQSVKSLWGEIFDNPQLIQLWMIQNFSPMAVHYLIFLETWACNLLLRMITLLSNRSLLRFEWPITTAIGLPNKSLMWLLGSWTQHGVDLFSPKKTNWW